jgi:hypothetical protein
MSVQTKLAAVIYLLVLLNISVLFGQSVSCFYCGKVIKGSYLQVDDKYYHRNHFLCEYCKKTLNGEFISDDSKFYHSECYADLKELKCAHCEKNLTEEYIVSEGKKYHKDCYEAVSPKCGICGKTLEGTYIIDYYGNKYHSFHERDYERCTSCNRLISNSITKGGRSYSDGRSICNLCFPEAVLDQGRFSGLLEKVRIKLVDFGISLSTAQVSIKGVSLYELKNAAGNNFSENIKGFCETNITTTNGKGTKYSHKIFVLNGLPVINIESIIAHELMHAWLAQNTKDNQSKSITEGSCNFISYLYLKKQNSDVRALQLIDGIEKDPSSVYGAGFRSIKSRFEGKDLSLLLNYLKGN